MKQRLILVAEDDPDQLEMLCNALMDAGFDVAAAHRGDDVVPRLEALRPILVIVDIHLPGISGLEILSRIRNHKELGAIPVMLVSAYYSSEKLDEIMRLGADSSFSKPYEMEEMIKEVRRLVGTDTAIETQKYKPS